MSAAAADDDDDGDEEQTEWTTNTVSGLLSPPGDLSVLWSVCCLQVNQENVVKVGHRQVVNMIRQGGNRLLIKVVTVSRNLDPDDTARKKGRAGTQPGAELGSTQTGPGLTFDLRPPVLKLCLPVLGAKG